MMKASNTIIALIALIALGVGYLSYRDYLGKCTLIPSSEDDGMIASRVLSMAFADRSVLNVRTARGTVRTVVKDVNMAGLTTTQISKAPFTADYTLDLGAIKPKDVKWNAETKTLLVNVPDVAISRPNVDEGNRYFVDTRGWWVSRRAGERLNWRTSAVATKTAQEEVSKPEHIIAARNSARKALGSFLRLPLRAAKLEVRGVEVVFPGENPSPDVDWDRSRSLADVYREKS